MRSFCLKERLCICFYSFFLEGMFFGHPRYSQPLGALVALPRLFRIFVAKETTAEPMEDEGTEGTEELLA